ncbi:hypothetical protein [Streptomyces xylophagus]|uniref:hypothetical protein n=1 Tax=Streptomyces xylophagus TaxID=285514 RepID=UPI00131EAC34
MAEPVQQRDRALDDPAVYAQAGAVFGDAAGDARGGLDRRTLWWIVDLCVRIAIELPPM